MQHCSPSARPLIGLALVAVMTATRFHHFGDALHLPDASWAIYFLAGFYLTPAWLAVLLAEAVAIDYAAIEWLGSSGFCVTPAYAALLPAYAALWLGGRWLARRASGTAGDLVRLAGAGWVSASLAYLISNAAFYWLGGRVGETSLGHYAGHFLHYYPHFVGTTLLYLAVAAAAHGLIGQFARRGRAIR